MVHHAHHCRCCGVLQASPDRPLPARPATPADDAGVASSPSRSSPTRRGGAAAQSAPPVRQQQQQQQDSGASSSTQQALQSSGVPQPSASTASQGGGSAMAPPSPRAADASALLHGCPPYGTKSVIGRRPKMEDACVAVPYLAEVPVLEAALDELLPPRIAPQLRGSAAPDAPGLGGELRAGAGGDRPSSSSGSDAMETLHFFGVFDGHGGADAAMHCARTLHERVREVLSACVSPGAGGGAGLPLQPAEASRAGGDPGDAGGDPEEGPSASSSSGNDAPAAMELGLRDAGAALSGSAAAAGRSPFADAAPAAPMASASSDNSSSYLECEGDGSGDAAAGGGRVEGVACTSETIEGALTKAFHITGEQRVCTPAHACGCRRAVRRGHIRGPPPGAAGSAAAHAPPPRRATPGPRSLPPRPAIAPSSPPPPPPGATDEEFGNLGGYEHLALVGTTAVVALLGTRMIYVANCGDSRAVLSRGGAAVPLTDDHKAAREDETVGLGGGGA